jgi:hypothetical protein
VLGLRLAGGAMVPPTGFAPAGALSLVRAARDTTRSPFPGVPGLRLSAQQIVAEPAISRDDGHGH